MNQGSRHHDHDPGHGPAATHDAAEPSCRCRRRVPGRHQPCHLLASTHRRRLHGGGAGARDGAGGCRARGLAPRFPRAPPSRCAKPLPAPVHEHGGAARRFAVVGRLRRLVPGHRPPPGGRRLADGPPRHRAGVPGRRIEWDGSLQDRQGPACRADPVARRADPRPPRRAATPLADQRERPRSVPHGAAPGVGAVAAFDHAHGRVSTGSTTGSRRVHHMGGPLHIRATGTFAGRGILLDGAVSWREARRRTSCLAPIPTARSRCRRVSFVDAHEIAAVGADNTAVESIPFTTTCVPCYGAPEQRERLMADRVSSVVPSGRTASGFTTLIGAAAEPNSANRSG